MSKATAITIGNFDGVHRGHARLIQRCREAVGPSGRVVALCFDPNPLSVLRPGSEPPRLSTMEQRFRWLHALGADQVERIEPTKDMLGQSAEEFLNWLAAAFQPREIVVGPDFRFGRSRQGSVQTLRQFEQILDYRTHTIESVETALADQAIVAARSTMIRWLVGRGRVRDAARLLGRAFELETPVVRGDQRGRTIGVPTANLDHGDLLLPADGIYAGRATIVGGRHSAWWPAAISIGTKPTFGAHPRTCEAHLVGFPGQLDDYGWQIRLEIHDWLRDQLAFASAGKLIEQLHRDIRKTEDMMRFNVNPAISMAWARE